MAQAIAEMLSTRLAEIVGADRVLDGEAERAFFSTDLASRGETTSAVVKIASTEELSRVVALCSGLGLAVIPRGGGFPIPVATHRSMPQASRWTCVGSTKSSKSMPKTCMCASARAAPGAIYMKR